MFRITRRLQRTGLIGMGFFGAFFGLVQTVAYNSAAGTTAASRALFGHQMEVLGPTVSLFLPIPIRVDTAAGYLQWRAFGGLPLLFGFWAIMSASGATRGDEERGLLEQWLTWGVGRTRYVWTRFGGFSAAATIAVAITALTILGGARAAGTTLSVSAVVEDSLALLALIVACFAIVLVVAQLVTSRSAAASVGGGLLLVMYLVDGASRTAAGILPVARLTSPFYYYDQTTALRPGGSFDIVATVGLGLLAVLLVALASRLMTVRDVGSPLFRRTPRAAPPTTRSSTNQLLRLPVLSTLYEQRLGLAAWSAVTSLTAAFMAGLATQMGPLINSPGAFHAYLAVIGHGDPKVALAGYFWFAFFELLLSVFAITQVARWSADDQEGRLEMMLTAPVSRARVVLERAAALACASLMVIGISSLAFYASARASNIDLRAGDVVVASLVMAPFALTFGAVGAVLASRVPRAAVAILATVAFASYLVAQLGPLLKLPEVVQKLAVFTLVGNPLTDGVYWTGLWIMLAVVVAGFGAATVLMQRREVGR